MKRTEKGRGPQGGKHHYKNTCHISKPCCYVGLCHFSSVVPLQEKYQRKLCRKSQITIKNDLFFEDRNDDRLCRFSLIYFYLRTGMKPLEDLTIVPGFGRALNYHKNKMKGEYIFPTFASSQILFR